MKSILISIRPQWVAEILNGEKTIEVRRSKPKRELPIDVLIYCTNGGGCITSGYTPSGKTYPYFPKGHSNFSGKVVGKFRLRKVDKLDMENPYGEPTRRLLNEACVTLGEARTYAGGTHPRYNPLFAWHISDLEIFDEPKPLSEFGLKRAPQSYCYVEVEE